MLKLFLVGFWPDYEKLFFSSCRMKNTEILSFNPKQHAEKNPGFKYFPRPIKNQIYTSLVLKLIKNNPDAIVIFQDNRLFLKLLLKSQPKITGGILMRNIASNNTKLEALIPSVQALGYNFWSFDESDCASYGFKPYQQFISKLPENKIAKPDLDFIFIGQDKGRSNLLKDFKKKSKKLGFKSHIEIKSAGNFLPYEDYIKTQLKAKCILDLVQKNQDGMTLRPLEALMYKQKLVSNNLSLSKSDFYKKENIFLIENDSINYQKLALFMQQNILDIDPEIIQTHHTETILKKIINEV